MFGVKLTPTIGPARWVAAAILGERVLLPLRNIFEETLDRILLPIPASGQQVPDFQLVENADAPLDADPFQPAVNSAGTFSGSEPENRPFGEAIQAALLRLVMDLRPINSTEFAWLESASFLLDAINSC